MTGSLIGHAACPMSDRSARAVAASVVARDWDWQRRVMPHRSDALIVARFRALVDDAVVDLLLPTEFEVSSERIFAGARVRSAVVWVVLSGMFLVLVATVSIATFGQPDGPVWLAGVPLPMIILGATSGAFMVALWVLPLVRPGLRKISATTGRAILVVGSTPLSRRFLVISHGGVLLLDDRGRRIGSWPHDRVQVTALRQFTNVVALLIVSEDRFFELPISHALGGPAAPMWSNGGALGRKALRDLIATQLREAAYPHIDEALVG